MENFSDLIKKRRSTRKFTEEELTQEQVVSLLKAGLMAPSSKRSNCWQFIVVDDKETLEKLSHCKESGATFVSDAALAIVVTADPMVSDVWIEDASVASILIQLQAEDLGLEAAGFNCVNGLQQTACPPTNMCMRYSTCLSSYRLFPSLPSVTKEWNGNRLMKATCNGKRYTLTNMEGNNHVGIQPQRHLSGHWGIPGTDGHPLSA